MSVNHEILKTYILSCSLEEVERCKQKKMLEDMLEEMAEDFPPLKRVFVVERDMYLCHSLQVAALQQRKYLNKININMFNIHTQYKVGNPVNSHNA